MSKKSVIVLIYDRHKLLDLIYTVAYLVEALCYKLEGDWFDSQ
jgi:hypothetical protein